MALGRQIARHRHRPGRLRREPRDGRSRPRRAPSGRDSPRSLAAVACSSLGMTAFYQGRLWEARALLAGRAQDRRGGGPVPSTLFRVLVMLPSITGPRRPAGPRSRPSATAIALARRLGNRSERDQHHRATWSRTRAGPATGTGRSASWRRDRAARHRRVEPRRQPDRTGVLRGLPRDPRRDELHRGLRRRTEMLDDRDVGPGSSTSTASSAYAAGRLGRAAAAWMPSPSDERPQRTLQPAEGRPRGDPRRRSADGARRGARPAGALGTRGRAIDADRAAIRAGIAALEGDRAAALAGYRTAISAYRDLGLPGTRRWSGMEAARRLGNADAELAGWTRRARAILTRLGAAPLLARLDEAIEHGNAGSTAARRRARVARRPRSRRTAR